jgi:hypothetical protein
MFKKSKTPFPPKVALQACMGINLKLGYLGEAGQK